MTPTQRTRAELKRRGWTNDIVEHRVPRVNILRDLFGGIDIVAIVPGIILGIQTCSGTDHAKRRAKLLTEPRMKLWLEAGGKLAVWSWSKKGARGKMKRWTLREEELTLAQFVPCAHNT